MGDLIKGLKGDIDNEMHYLDMAIDKLPEGTVNDLARNVHNVLSYTQEAIEEIEKKVVRMSDEIITINEALDDMEDKIKDMEEDLASINQPLESVRSREDISTPLPPVGEEDPFPNVIRFKS